jgi:hypothetical protein
MFHPKHVEPFAGNKILYKKKCHVVGAFLKLKMQFLVKQVAFPACYRLYGLGIESQSRGGFFQTHSDRPWGSPNLLYNGYWISFLWVEWLGSGVDHPPLLGPYIFPMPLQVAI